MSSFRPLTVMCPCVIICRAWGRLAANPSRVTTLSSRRSRSDIRASPVFPGRRAGFFVVLAELPLEDPVVALDLLFLPQADGILAGLAAAELMHARHAVATIDGALGRVAPRPFQEELGAFAAAQPANRSNMTSHGGMSSPRSSGTRGIEVSLIGESRRSACGRLTSWLDFDRCSRLPISRRCSRGSSAGCLDPAFLGRAAAVVRQRRDVFDGLDQQARTPGSP